MKKKDFFDHGKRHVMRIGALVIAGMLTVSAALTQGGTIVTYADNSKQSDVLSETINESNIPGTVTTQSKYNDSFLSVTGYASVDGNIKDRSEYVGTEYYRTINNEREFLDALVDAQSGLVKVMEITTDMDLGYDALNLSSDERKKYSMVSKYGKPNNELGNVNGGFTNPLMQVSGVTKISLSNINGLTIFSKNASSIKHTELKLNSSSSDIVIRNLKFKEMWQWDDKGTQKEVGWSNLKINGAKNVWVDHCSFEMASDGNIDLENGATGVTISWCEIGLTATENPSKDSSIYQSIMFMEGRYKRDELNPETSLYYQMRKGGATPQQIMAYSAYHKKCHLNGSGDKDFVNYVNKDGKVTEDANSNIRLTLAYNHYSNAGERVPMIRQGTGNLINCYIDDSTHAAAAAASPIFGEVGPYSLSRCLNPRNGASIAADTCVFEGVEEPIIGAEIQADYAMYMDPLWEHLFQKAYNRALIVNSTVTNSKGTYTGGSWDNNGENLFTTAFTWKDKSTIGQWAWSSSIVGKENYIKDKPPTENDAPFEFTYDTESGLPFEYQVLPLEDVKEVVSEKSGAGVIDMSSAEWLKTAYLADADYSAVDSAIEKANSLNASDYVDFTAVTNALKAVEEGLKSDQQEKVDAMAKAIEDAINALVKIPVEEPTTKPTEPETKPTEPATKPSGGVAVEGKDVIAEIPAGTVIKNADGSITTGTVYLNASKDGEKAETGKKAIIKALKEKGMIIDKNASVQYMDISLNDAAGNNLTFDGKLRITLPFPGDSAKDGYSFKIVHLKKDGSIEMLTPVLTDKGLQVDVDELSPFAIVYKNAAATSETLVTTSPKTGDNNMAVIYILAALSGLGMLAMGIKKTSKKIS